MFKKTLIAILLVVTVFTIFHLMVSNSVGFKTATNFLEKNSEVAKVVGVVLQTSLVPLASSIREGSIDGSARYYIKVKGSSGLAEGVVTSKKSAGVWSIEKAHLILENGNVVIIKQ